MCPAPYKRNMLNNLQSNRIGREGLIERPVLMSGLKPSLLQEKFFWVGEMTQQVSADGASLRARTM